MKLGFYRLMIVFATVVLSLVVARNAWSAIPHADLLAILWGFSFVAIACATITYQIRTKYSDIIGHLSLTESESRRLNQVIKKRQRHITVFIFCSFLIAILLGISNLFNHFSTVAPGYFILITTSLAIEIVLFTFILLSFQEIEAFKYILEGRKKNSEERKRLLEKLSSNET